jgi:hypothetical protein
MFAEYLLQSMHEVGGIKNKNATEQLFSSIVREEIMNTFQVL